MPTSTQKHRQGASLSQSTSTRVKTLLARATDLENQLTSVVKSNEEEAAGLRSHLCEILSDVLISDPPTGLRHDCAARLWRNCFYSPIGLWRKKIIREKRKQGRGLKNLDQNYKKFLGEAVTLYDYLIVQYQSKLVPCSQSQEALQQSTQESTPPSEHFLQAVVQGLYRLYIHLGDLHRYAESFNKAETCYFNASKLAPGLGNPYNQLAVVSQMKDSNLSCVALYYYFRSLLATHEPFETSNSNLERLFHANRSYIREHARDSSPPLFVGGKKKANAEMQRAQKAAASKSCLAHFVDLHFELFKEPGIEHDDDTLVRKKMDGIIKSFDSLVQASAFSDSLLSKMVLINTFAIETKAREKSELDLLVAKDLLFHFGVSLASKLRSSISKVIEKTGKPPSSIRMLVPFCLLCEYVAHFSLGTETSPAMERFWKEFELVSTRLRQISGRWDLSAESSKDTLALKEYGMVQGFQPYAFLFPSYAQEEPYIDPERAVDVLELTPSQSQESGYAGYNDIKMRFFRFLKLCDDLSSRSECPVLLPGKDVVVLSFDEPNIQQSCRPSSAVVENKVMQLGEREQGSFQTDFPESKFRGIASDPTFATFEKESIEVNQLISPSRASPLDETLKYSQHIKPPPGFEIRATNTLLGSTSQSHDSLKNLGFTDLTSLPQRQPSQLHQAVHVSPFGIATLQEFPGTAQTIQYFGERGLYTDNPFVDHAMRGMPTLPNGVLGNTNTAIENSSFLGSALLDSLFTNDAGSRKTENPFFS